MVEPAPAAWRCSRQRASGLALTKLVALLCLAACADSKVTDSDTELSVEPRALAFELTWVGHPSEKQLELVNRGRSPQAIAVTVEGPFQLSDLPTELAGAARQALRVRFLPEGAGDFDGAIRIAHEGGALEIPLSGTAEVPPVCGDSECHKGSFDPAAGACRQLAVADGTACANPCLDEPACEQGRCVGKPKSCDDHNVCTVDSCDPVSGCRHLDTTAQCPTPSNPCRVAVCAPESGCGEADAADYTPCGSVSCEAANVCFSGACVEFDPPEGFPCAAATPCQDIGVCKARKCERPAPGPLATAWTYAPAEKHYKAELVLADVDGNLYVRNWPYVTENDCALLYAGSQEELDRCVADRKAYRSPLVSLTPAGAVRWTHAAEGSVEPVFVDHGRVWARRGASETLVLDASSGAAILVIPQSFDAFQVGEGIVVGVRRWLVAGGEVGITAFDARSGARLWATSFSQDGEYTSGEAVVLDGDRVLVLLRNSASISTMVLFDDSGNELSRQSGGLLEPLLMPTRSFAVFSGRRTTLNGFDAQNFSFEWQADILQGVAGGLGPVVGGERLYLAVAKEVGPASFARTVEARRLSDGRVEWAQWRGQTSSLAGVIAQDQSWLTGRETLFFEETYYPTRRVGELRAATGDLLYECTLNGDEDVVTIGDGRMYVNTGGGVKALSIPNLEVAKRGWITRKGNPGLSNRPW